MGAWVEVAGLPAAPDQLREDKQAGEGEDAQEGSSDVLNSFKAGKEFSPEERDRDQGEEADAGDEIGDPVGNLGAGEVGDGMEKDGGQSEDEGRPDDDTECTGPFGKKEKRCQEKRESDDVDDDRDDDGGGRTDEVVDEIVLGGDERTGEVEQIQVREAEGDRGRMSEWLSQPVFFQSEITGCEHAHTPFQIRIEIWLCAAESARIPRKGYKAFLL